MFMFLLLLHDQTHDTKNEAEVTKHKAQVTTIGTQIAGCLAIKLRLNVVLPEKISLYII